MYCKASWCLGASIPDTFSAKKNFGFLSRSIRINSKNNCPLLSPIPRNFPASLQLWQGGPPIIPSHSGISSNPISRIDFLFNFVLGKFFSNVSHISLSNSFAHTISKPAFSSLGLSHLHLKTKKLFS